MHADSISITAAAASAASATAEANNAGMSCHRWSRYCARIEYNTIRSFGDSEQESSERLSVECGGYHHDDRALLRPLHGISP